MGILSYHLLFTTLSTSIICNLYFTVLINVSYLLKKQILLYNYLIITPPRFFQRNKACFVWEVMTFIEGVPSKKYNQSNFTNNKH